MISSEALLIFTVVFLAVIFDFINGFHDTANAVAPSISTRALNPSGAIMLASCMNLAGALTFTGVARTVGGKVADPFNLPNGILIVIAALLTSIAWNLITWYRGIPSSSSHALIGSLAGAAVAGSGTKAVNLTGMCQIACGLILSPVIAFVTGILIMTFVNILFANARLPAVNRGFRSMQAFTATFQAFSHGTNDAQKTMGVITFALIAGGFQDTMEIALWVKLAAAAAMALGTAMGGWRIIRTVGTQIIKLEPPSGFSADLGSALIIFTATIAGLPVSTTHIVSSSLMGVGAARRISAVKWQTAFNMVTTWLVTIPAAFCLAFAFYKLINCLAGALP